MLSVIIPSRNEQGYLEQTLDSLLKNAHGEIEIIVVLDGWRPNPEIIVPVDDRRSVVWIHNQESIGQRQAINQAAEIAKGDYIMKLDAHCAVAEGFDVILARDCEYDMTMIPRMYNLNVVDWTPKLHKRTDYMFIGLKDGNLRAMYYDNNHAKMLGLKKLKQPDNPEMIDDIMCCMGPCFFMHTKRFWELEACDENHGGWGQQGIEVACKAWLSGGRLVVNKNTWFAHWFRGGGVPEGHKKGFPYSLKQRLVNIARAYSNDLWMNDKWPKQVRTFQWLIDKFDAPGWQKQPEKGLNGAKVGDKILEAKKTFYTHMFSGNKMPNWMGYKVVKYPTDLIIYQQKLFEQKPDILVEVGTYAGGSALFFAHMMDLIGHGQIISIDRNHTKFPLPQHPRITYLTGKSTAVDTLESLREMVEGKTVMVTLDGNHSRRQVKRELKKYSKIVSKGHYIVAEDTILGEVGKPGGPDEAVDWYLKHHNDLVHEPVEEQFMMSCNPGGWLKRIA